MNIYSYFFYFFEELLFLHWYKNGLFTQDDIIVYDHPFEKITTKKKVILMNFIFLWKDKVLHQV